MRMDNPWRGCKLRLLWDVWILSLTKNLMHESLWFEFLGKSAAWRSAPFTAAWVSAAARVAATFASCRALAPWGRTIWLIAFLFWTLTLKFWLCWLLHLGWYEFTWFFGLLLHYNSLTFVNLFLSAIWAAIIPRSLMFFFCWRSHRRRDSVSAWLVPFTFSALTLKLQAIFTNELPFLRNPVRSAWAWITFRIAPTTTSPRTFFPSFGAVTAAMSMSVISITPWRPTVPFCLHNNIFPIWSSTRWLVAAILVSMVIFIGTVGPSLVTWMFSTWTRTVASSVRIAVFFLVRKFVGGSVVGIFSAFSSVTSFASIRSPFTFVRHPRIVLVVWSSGGQRFVKILHRFWDLRRNWQLPLLFMIYIILR